MNEGMVLYWMVMTDMLDWSRGEKWKKKKSELNTTLREKGWDEASIRSIEIFTRNLRRASVIPDDWDFVSILGEIRPLLRQIRCALRLDSFAFVVHTVEPQWIRCCSIDVECGNRRFDDGWQNFHSYVEDMPTVWELHLALEDYHQYWS